MFNRSKSDFQPTAPIAEYYPGIRIAVKIFFCCWLAAPKGRISLSWFFLMNIDVLAFRILLNCILTFSFSALGEANLLVINHKLEVLSYATKDLLLIHMVSKLIIPGLVDQLHSLKNKIMPDLMKKHRQVRWSYSTTLICSVPWEQSLFYGYHVGCCFKQINIEWAVCLFM